MQRYIQQTGRTRSRVLAAHPHPSCLIGPPSSYRGRREDRVSADTRGPRAAKEHAAEPQAQPISGLPCAMVLRLIRALPGDRLSCPRRQRDARKRIIASLTPAPRRQDHTTSPYTPCRSSYVRTHTAARRVHRVPLPTSRDDRDTPLHAEAGRAERSF
jgi:hypothetical protein